ncbi:16S rRNA (uracil(1498)-N(3))-methyltransferase [Aerococcus viridans]
MQRYFIEEETAQLNDQIEMDKDAYHHMINVMRMQIGDQVILVTQTEQVFIGELVSDEGKRAVFRLVELREENKEIPVDTTLFVGLPKGDKLDLIVQKATELGVRHIVPVAMRYSVTKWDQKKAGKKIDRLKKIAKEAAEQSHRTFVPTVEDLHSVSMVRNRVGEFDQVCVAYEEVAKSGEAALLAKTYASLKAKDRIAFITGPEGGIHPDEIVEFTDGFDHVHLCGLGPRILRTETAPLYLLSSLSFATELLGD